MGIINDFLNENEHNNNNSDKKQNPDTSPDFAFIVSQALKSLKKAPGKKSFEAEGTKNLHFRLNVNILKIIRKRKEPKSQNSQQCNKY